MLPKTHKLLISPDTAFTGEHSLGAPYISSVAPFRTTPGSGRSRAFLSLYLLFNNIITIIIKPLIIFIVFIIIVSIYICRGTAENKQYTPKIMRASYMLSCGKTPGGLLMTWIYFNPNMDK